MNLDVGCGDTPHPNANVLVDVSLFMLSENKENIRTRAGILADACHLPFRNKIFDWSYSSHTIEHVSNPQLMLRELERVTIFRVEIKCPSRWMKGHKGNKYHKWTITRRWFNKLGYSTYLNLTTIFIIPPFRIQLPNEILAEKTL